MHLTAFMGQWEYEGISIALSHMELGNSVGSMTVCDAGDLGSILLISAGLFLDYWLAPRPTQP